MTHFYIYWSHLFHWSPGIGDSTVGGWLTVVLYILATMSCWRTSAALAQAPRASEYRTWQAITVVFLALSINKLLNVEAALTEIGRILALSGGWYWRRYDVQVLLILAVTVACIVISIGLVILARRSRMLTWFALVGMTFVLGFVLIRTISFHPMDRFLARKALGLRWNGILEMAGIAVVLLSSEWRRRLKAAAVAQPWATPSASSPRSRMKGTIRSSSSSR